MNNILENVLFEVEKEDNWYLFRCVEHSAVYGEMPSLENIVQEAIDLAEFIFSTWNENEVTRKQFNRVSFNHLNPNQFSVSFDLNTGKAIEVNFNENNIFN